MAKARAKPAGETKTVSKKKEPETPAELQAADKERRWAKHEARRARWKAPFGG